MLCREAVELQASGKACVKGEGGRDKRSSVMVKFWDLLWKWFKQPDAPSHVNNEKVYHLPGSEKKQKENEELSTLEMCWL